MENNRNNLSKPLFHTQILETGLKQLSLNSQKVILQAWVDRLGELNKKDKAFQSSAFSTEILEKLLGYSASGNTVTIETDATPDHFFDLLLGQFKPANQKAVAALKLVESASTETGISPETEKNFKDEAWKFAELEKDGFYLLTDLNEIRLYPRNRKDKACERFVLSEIMENDVAFARFYLLLNAINLLSGKTAKWLHESAILFLNEKLKSTHQTLKEIYGPVYAGIVTGLDEAFVIDETTKERLIKEDPRSADILKPYVDKADLDKWLTDSRSIWLIYTPENLYDIENYPAIKNHLMPFREKLEKRDGTQKWYELQHVGTHPEKMFATKLGFSRQSHNPTFAIDKNEGVYDHTGFYTTESDYYLVALLNSSVLWYLIRKNSIKKPDGTYELSAAEIEKLPVPDAPGLVRGRMGQLSDFCHDTVLTRNDLIKHFRGMTAYNLLPEGLSSKLTQRLHNWFSLEFDTFRSEIVDSFKTDIPADDIQLWNDYFYQERNKVFNMNADIARAEKEIDLLVYELFGLSPDEIDLIERMV